MVLVLAGVVGVIYLLFLLLKRGAKAKRPDNELIKLLDYQGLSGNRGLHLVGVGNNMYLVGSSENGVTLISEIKDKESLDSLRLDLSQKILPSKKSFSELLLGIFKPSNKRVISFADSLGFMKNQKERLKKLR